VRITPTLLRPVSNLGIVYHVQARLDEAETLYRRALTIWEKTIGLNSPTAAFALNKRLLAIREKALGPEHTYVADSLNNLGNVYLELSRYTEALELYDRAIVIRDRLHGPNHIVTARDLKNVALEHEALGDLTQALASTRRATAAVGLFRPIVISKLHRAGKPAASCDF
jgi:tetratricopeptide (TPR) repeat protein